MNSILIFMMVGGLIFGLFVLVWYMAVYRVKDSGSYFDPRRIDWDVINAPDIQEALSRGKKIEAIKHYRTHTNVGLKEAKDAIEYAFDHPEEAERKKRSPVNDLSDGGVRDLIEEGRIEEAVEVYRTFTGMDEFSARAAVERIRGER